MTKNEVYSLRLPQELREQLRLLAEANGMAPSALVRGLIEQEIEKVPFILVSDIFAEQERAEQERARKISKMVEKIHKLTDQILEA